MMEVLTSQDVTTQLVKLNANLQISLRVLRDSSTIKDQRIVVQPNVDRKTARITHLHQLLTLPCADCKHPRIDHISGSAKCVHDLRTNPCDCVQWTVIDGD